MKKKFSRILALMLVLVMATGMVACWKQPETPPEADGRTVIYYAAAYVDAQMQAAYSELVNTYNNTQGVTDGVYVQFKGTPGGISGLESALRKNYQYDVIELRDDSFKSLATNGNFFVTLDDYLTNDVKAAMNWNDIPESLVNRYRLNTTKSSNGKYQAGTGANLLALPNGSDPQMLFYNKNMMKASGINIISVPESELAAYNAANNANLMPHGYAEYKTAPYAGAKSSTNQAGQTVYKVFNECIGMNWEEQRCLASAFTTSEQYGFVSEWWFNMGFSVGADCIGWDAASNNYKLTLGDEQPGYLALEDITVNGHSYKKGEVLHYEDKSFLNNNASTLETLNGKVYELPSTYDAILEFTRLGVPSNKQTENGVYGYGVAPSTTEGRNQLFTSGKCLMLIEDFRNIQSFKNVLGNGLGMAVTAQYREYVGGSTYTENGKEYLKVIGETYNGEVYTGELHMENGTPIVGEAATESESVGLFLPMNTKNKNYDAAFKFASWVAGPEGQTIMAKGNKYVPNQTSIGMGEAYNSSSDRLISNMWAGSFLAQRADIGDYAYFTSTTWITEWSVPFNTKVREGNMMLADFYANYEATANNLLKGMTIQINGR